MIECYWTSYTSFLLVGLYTSWFKQICLRLPVQCIKLPPNSSHCDDGKQMAQSFQLKLFWQKTGFQQNNSCLCEECLLPVENLIILSIKLSKHDDTEYFPIEVHKSETWDLLCKCFVCSNFCLGQISQMDYIFYDAIKFHQVFTGWKQKVFRMTWNKTFAEGLQLIENNVRKKYFNSIFHRLIEHLQINISPLCYSPMHYLFSEVPLYGPYSRNIHLPVEQKHWLLL